MANFKKSLALLLALGLLATTAYAQGSFKQAAKQAKSQPSKPVAQEQPAPTQEPVKKVEKIEEVVTPQKEQRNLIAYDEDHIVQLGSHNHADFTELVQSKSNSSTVVWLIYANWCQHSQEFLPEYKKLASLMYKIGDLTDSVFFAKIDNDQEAEFIKKQEFPVDGLPTIFIEQYNNGTSEGKVAYDGLRTADELFKFIRSFRPVRPQLIKSQEELQALRQRLSHHLVVGLIYNRPTEEAGEIVRGLTEIQIKNPNFKIVVVNDSSVIPYNALDFIVSPLVVLRHPIFEQYTGIITNVVIHHRGDGTTIDEEKTEINIRKALRSGKIDYIDVMNVELFSSFERSIVALITTHPSVDDLSRPTNIEFFQLIAKFLYQGGLSKFSEYDFAIINGLEIVDVAHDFQLDTLPILQDQKFFLAILKDIDTGYLYNGPIIKESEAFPDVMTADTITQFVRDFRDRKLQPYLRTESRDSTPVVKDGILQIYGSNFISIVKDRKWAPAEEEKGLLLFFTKADCDKCDWNEAYFEKLLMEEIFNSTFVFARMDIDKNRPTYEFNEYLYTLSSDAEETQPRTMLQFIAFLPDGGNIRRFQKEGENYQDIYDFVDRARQLIELTKKPAPATPKTEL